MSTVVCPNCGKDITDTIFTVDSEYSGTIDTGYECSDCKLEVYTYLVKKRQSED